MSDSNGKGQVAQVARWPATLKASGCLCLLDGLGMAKRRLNQVIQPPDYRCRSIVVRHHYGDGGLWIVNVQRATSDDEVDGIRCAIVVSDMNGNVFNAELHCLEETRQRQDGWQRDRSEEHTSELQSLR